MITLLASCSETSSSDEEFYYDEPEVEENELDQSLTDTPDFGAILDSDRSSYSGGSGVRYDANEDEREPFDEFAARRAAERDLALEGYDYSYGCTQDCSGHEAGWQWRADNGYSVDGKSQSFAEGGYAFDEALDRRIDEIRDDYDSGVDPDY